MRILTLYALAGAAAVTLVVAALALLLPAAALGAVGWMGALAWAVQVMLFAPLLAARGKRNAFLAAWGGGTLVRFAVLGAAAWWVWHSQALPLAPALLALAGFLFLLLLLEPVFFRMGLRAQ
ncbi:MAG TPA: hypothetical protein VF832_10140 [Longimicrobiales bacterium]